MSLRLWRLTNDSSVPTCKLPFQIGYDSTSFAAIILLLASVMVTMLRVSTASSSSVDWFSLSCEKNISTFKSMFNLPTVPL